MTNLILIVVYVCGFYEVMRTMLARRRGLPQVPDRMYYTVNFCLCLIWPVMTIVKAATDLTEEKNG